MVQATNDKGKTVTSGEILALVKDCDWVKTDDMSDTLYAKNGYMYPIGLEIGYSDIDGDNKLLFFNAYYE